MELNSNLVHGAEQRNKKRRVLLTGPAGFAANRGGYAMNKSTLVLNFGREGAQDALTEVLRKEDREPSDARGVCKIKCV